MRQSQLFTKTLKEAPSDEPSINAQLLTRGGFVYKNSAGVYSYLPLGWRVIGKINKIIREEMNNIGGVEMFMPALVDRKYLEATDRFKLDVGFDALGKKDERGKAPYSLGWTHEEVLTAITSKYISSYKDLPVFLYQIQTKFRNEARAKSGLLRGREFLMKDLYSFHVSQDDLFIYYSRVKDAYFNVFKRCGMHTYYTVAGGGDFTMTNTHEFQVLSDVGEDTIFYCEKCKYAENSEISKLKEGDKCLSSPPSHKASEGHGVALAKEGPQCGGNVVQSSAIEVGNIFPLGTKYSEALGLNFTDDTGNKNPVVMGSYGIGVSRLMGTVVEIHHDDKGIIWPKEIAPFDIHLICLHANVSKVAGEADKIYDLLQNKGIEVLYDDRADTTPGEKFADADLIGLPTRIVISTKTIEAEGMEIKKRNQEKASIMSVDEFLNKEL